MSDILAQGEGCPARMLQQQRVFRDSRTSPRWRTGWSPTGPCSTDSTAIEPQGEVIGEEDTGSNKYVISDVDALEDHHLVLAVTRSPDPGAVLHKGSVTDVAVASDARASQDVGECP